VNIALLVARLGLALVFAVSGGAKVMDLAGTREALASFGVPEPLRRSGSVALPVLELAVAVLLVPLATAWWGAIGAMVLLGGFTAAMLRSLAAGERPDCHCFGQLHSEPIGWRSILRNVVLLGAAGFVVVAGHSDAGHSVVPAGTSSLTIVVIVALSLLALAVIGEGVVLYSLVVSHGGVLRRLTEAGALSEPLPPASGLPVGAEAPGFVLAGLHGDTQTLSALRASGRPVMLIFTDPGCGPCAELTPEIGVWQSDHASTVTIAIVSRGSREDNLAKTAEHLLSNVVLQDDDEVSSAYGSPGTPSAVVVDAQGRIATPMAGGAPAVRALFASFVDTPRAQPAPVHLPDPKVSPIGRPAPEVTLPDLDGEVVTVADDPSSTTVLFFWSPGCGFCTQILDDVRAREHGADGVRFVFVSTGSVADNRALGLDSTVLLEEQFGVGRAFGATGTPSAVLIDTEGKVASPLAVGGPEVLALADRAVVGSDQP